MRTFLLIAALLACSAAAVAQEQIVAPKFQVLDYNSVANEYLPVPTFVTLRTTKKGDADLSVEYDFYGVGEYQNETAIMNFRRSAAEQHRAFIAKYLEWEAMASRDGDQFQKKIGQVDAVRGKLQFEFASAAATKHLLVVKYCTIGICLDDPIVLDREGALGLDAMLQDFIENGVQPVDVDAKYN